MVFAVDQEYFGTFNKVELKPGGSQIPLTEENKVFSFLFIYLFFVANSFNFFFFLKLA
mgnify:CR=1 FL=1